MAENRPTKEDLEAEHQKIVAELDAPETPEEKPEEKEHTIEEPKKEEKEVEILDESDNIEKEEPKEEKKPPTEEELKKKLSASARENQKIYAKNRKLNQALDDADNIPEPTEEEMIEEYPEWDVMDAVTKKLARKTVKQERFQTRLSQAREEARKIEKWDDEVVKFVENPQTYIDNPELEGKEEEFRQYAAGEENNSVPFKLLVNSFLYEKSITKPAPKKGKMFETGSGGPNDNPKPNGDTISTAESIELRDRDYKKYLEYLKAGKIRTDDI